MAVGGTGAVDDESAIRGTWTAARMPDSVALQVHLLPIPKGIAAFRAAGARGMEVVVAACLQHLAADVSIAVGTLDTVRLLVALLAVRHTVLAHVLPIQNCRAVLTPVEEVIWVF